MQGRKPRSSNDCVGRRTVGGACGGRSHCPARPRPAARPLPPGRFSNTGLEGGAGPSTELRGGGPSHPPRKSIVDSLSAHGRGSRDPALNPAPLPDAEQMPPTPPAVSRRDQCLVSPRGPCRGACCAGAQAGPGKSPAPPRTPPCPLPVHLNPSWAHQCACRPQGPNGVSGVVQLL